MDPTSFTSKRGTKLFDSERGRTNGSAASNRRKKGVKSVDGNRGKKLVIARTGTAEKCPGRQAARGKQVVARYEDMVDGECRTMVSSVKKKMFFLL